VYVLVLGPKRLLVTDSHDNLLDYNLATSPASITSHLLVGKRARVAIGLGRAESGSPVGDRLRLLPGGGAGHTPHRRAVGGAPRVPLALFSRLSGTADEAGASVQRVGQPAGRGPADDRRLYHQHGAAHDGQKPTAGGVPAGAEGGRAPRDPPRWCARKS
jgi:hypothetical protein